MSQLIVLVTGSRLYDDAWTIKRVLDDVAEEAVAEEVDELVIRHGACYPNRDRQTGRIPAKSADWLAHLWIARFGPDHPIRIIVHRNRDMVLEDPRPDLGVAFLRDNSSGTSNCIKTMREFGIHVEEIPYELTDSPGPT